MIKIYLTQYDIDKICEIVNNTCIGKSLKGGVLRLS